MDFETFKIKIVEKAEKINVNLNDIQIKQFFDYMNLLITWNEKINLTAITDPDEIILKHFIDCLTIEKEIEKNSTLIDVGTGAGFPGIPLKISRPDLKITLVDSLNKRINFLQEVIKDLGLENISAIHSRVEETGRNKLYREKFDYCTSRAVANLAVLAEYMLPLTNVGGKAICMKGANLEEELADSKKAIKVLGGTVEKVEEFLLVDSDMKRNIVVIKKDQPTLSKFPRKAGTPSKEPIV